MAARDPSSNETENTTTIIKKGFYLQQFVAMKDVAGRGVVVGGGAWGTWGAAPPGLRGCRQISKISAFVGKSQIAGDFQDASIFFYILPTVS